MGTAPIVDAERIKEEYKKVCEDLTTLLEKMDTFLEGRCKFSYQESTFIQYCIKEKALSQYKATLESTAKQAGVIL